MRAPIDSADQYPDQGIPYHIAFLTPAARFPFGKECPRDGADHQDDAIIIHEQWTNLETTRHWFYLRFRLFFPVKMGFVAYIEDTLNCSNIT